MCRNWRTHLGNEEQNHERYTTKLFYSLLEGSQSWKVVWLLDSINLITFRVDPKWDKNQYTRHWVQLLFQLRLVTSFNSWHSLGCISLRRSVVLTWEYNWTLQVIPFSVHLSVGVVRGRLLPCCCWEGSLCGWGSKTLAMSGSFPATPLVWMLTWGTKYLNSGGNLCLNYILVLPFHFCLEIAINTKFCIGHRHFERG
jgi:hypothetical protein